MSRDPRRALAEAAAAAYEGDARAQAAAGRLLLDEPDGNPVQARDWLAAARAAGEFVSVDYIDLAERRVATAGMSDDELLYDCIAASGADHLATAIRASARPSLRLVASRVDADDDIVFGASKLGGGPDLEMGSDWPTVDGRRLGFVGQLALDGQPLLGFFYDAIAQPWGPVAGDPPGWRVIASATDDLARATPHDGVPTFHPCAITARNELTIPFPRTREARAFLSADDDWQKYMEVVSGFAIRPPYSDGRVHRSGGHPDAIQGDMPVRIESALNGVDIADPVGEWQLLLQVDSEPQAGMQWGGDGRLFFWIRAADLAAGRFDDVQVQLQTG